MQKKFSAAKVLKQALQIGGRECLLYTEGEQPPQVLLIQTLGEQERGSIDSEVEMIREMVDFCGGFP